MAENRSVITSGLNDGHVVEKSRPLMMLNSSHLSLGELKVLDTYLSRINARDPDHRAVRFSKSEFERLMGLQQIKPELLNAYTNNLHSFKVTLTDDREPGRTYKLNLFTVCEIFPDSKGQWWIDMVCSPEAKDYFFNVDGLRYFSYYLSNIIGLTGAYAYNLYMYILMQSYRGEWDEDIERLKDVLNCKSERYQQFKFFNSEVLKRAVAEVNEKTDMDFEYSVVKVGRVASKIHFKMNKIGKVSAKKNRQALSAPDQPAEVDPNEPSLFDFQTDEEIYGDEPPAKRTVYDESMDFIASALPEHFTRADVDLLRNLAMDEVPYYVASFDEKDRWVHDYLTKLVKLMRAQKTKITSEVGWLRNAIQKDYLGLRENA